MFYIYDFFKYKPLASSLASFMMQSPEVVFTSQWCLLRVHLWDCLPVWGWDHRLCCAEVMVGTETDSPI